MPSAEGKTDGPPAEAKGAENTKEEKKKKEVTKEKKQAGTAPAIPSGPLDVSRLDFRIGKILKAEKHPDADALYVEEVDIGEEKSRTVVSGLVKFVPIDQVRFVYDKTIIIIFNYQIRDATMFNSGLDGGFNLPPPPRRGHKNV